MLILASSSPRRKQLMKKINPRFKVVKPQVNERHYHYSVAIYPLKLAELKAKEVKKRYPKDDVLACDTIVVLNNEIINKPKNDQDAIRILKLLSNKTHTVMSGYVYLGKDQTIKRIVKTKVTFNKLSTLLINEYVKKGLAKGKAGAYGIQDGYPLVKTIVGSYDNVVGLPTEDIIANLNN